MDYDGRTTLAPLARPAGLPRMTGGTAARIAWAMCVLTLASIAGALGFAGPNHVAPGALSYLVFVVLFAIIGAVVASSQPANPVGWLFAASALGFALMELTGEYAIYGVVTRPGALPATPVMVWLQALFPIPAFMLVVAYVPLYFPDGRLLSPRWRVIARLEAVVVVAMSVVTAVLPVVNREGGSGGPGFANPLGIAALRPLAGVHDVALSILISLCMGTSTWSLVVRFRRSRGEERQQMKWLTYAVSASFVLFILSKPFPAVNPLGLVAFCGVPIAVAVAILRYRLWDIDLLINRTLVYGALTTVVVALYALVVGAISAVLQTRGSFAVSLAATGLVAVLFQPLRERLQRAVNHLLYGARDEPYAVLAGLGQRLEITLAPEAVLPAVVETVAHALKLPYVAITLRDGCDGCDGRGTGDGNAEDAPPAAACGAPVPALLTLTLPLVYQQETVGHLLLAPRAGTHGFSPADRRLLDALARQASVAARAVRLTADLQQARERLVLAREEERRRLRRDLHDGLGPTLAMLTLHVDGVRQTLRHDANAADRLLVELKTQMQGTVKDIRQLVYALRPPALDDLGLVGALRELARPYHADGLPSDAGPCMTVETPDVLPPLPAAVEVATYRIAQEAVTNVVRHAHARRCHLRVDVDEALTLVIVDDGVGLPAERRAGVGLGSMRERAEEVGGTCTIEAFPAGGTRVLARLPLRPAVETRRPARHTQAEREEPEP